MDTPSPSIAARNWVNAVRAVGAAGEAVRAAATKRERKATEKQFAEALKLEGQAFEALQASRGAYLGTAGQADDVSGLPENPEPVPGDVGEPDENGNAGIVPLILEPKA